jgi:hypothetical protein
MSEERLYATTELRERGLRPKTGERPAKIEEWKYHSRRGTRHLWRLDQTVAVKPRNLIPAEIEPTAENVLRAVWSVNRAAKRRRDAAQSSYQQAMHGFAGRHREQKEEYYRLKDRGIAWLAHKGHVAPTHRHGQLVVWEGLGYSFHSTLAPQEGPLPETGEGAAFIEARPRSAKEMRLVDAVALLSGLNSLVSNYRRLAAPAYPKRVRYRAGDEFDDEEDDDY